MNVLEVKNLKKSYGRRPAVQDISFSVREGEIYGLLGPNGAGKSTTLSLISGLFRPDQGQIRIDGWDVNKQPQQAKQRIGIVPQEPALYSTLSARANLHFWGTIQGLQGKELKAAVDRVLEMVGLTERADGQIQKYSGGMKRRLNIAAGLLHQPRLLIMDEPTVGIDPQSRNHILATVRALKEQGMTIVYTSHYVDEVEFLCDRVGIVDHGHLISEGTVSELISQGETSQELAIRLSSFSDELESSIQSLPGVQQAYLADEQLSIFASSIEQVLPLAFSCIVSHGGQVTEIKIQRPNLESLFLKLTGKALRD